MDHGEQQFQSLNICHRLYNFMKFLARNAHKMVISGRPMPHPLAQAPVTKEASSRSSQVVHPMAQGPPPNEDKDKSASNTASASNCEEKKGVDVEAAIPSCASEPKVPKKMVSINENVETISTSNKKKSKKKKKEQDQISDDSKPLKSILKVSSDVNNTADNQSLLSRANGA